MTRKDDVGKVECVQNLQNVALLTVQAAIFFWIEAGKVRLARADMIEGDRPVLGRKGGNDVLPGLLVAPEAMGK
mgnify:FL=1